MTGSVAPRYVEEGGVDDELVEGEVEVDKESAQFCIGFPAGCHSSPLGRIQVGSDVGCLSLDVLAVSGAADGGVQGGAAVTAVHVDGFAEGFAQGVEKNLHQMMEVLYDRGRGCVVDAQTESGVAAREFFEGEVLHILRTQKLKDKKKRAECLAKCN